MAKVFPEVLGTTTVDEDGIVVSFEDGSVRYKYDDGVLICVERGFLTLNVQGFILPGMTGIPVNCVQALYDYWKACREKELSGAS